VAAVIIACPASLQTSSSVAIAGRSCYLLVLKQSRAPSATMSLLKKLAGRSKRLSIPREVEDSNRHSIYSSPPEQKPDQKVGVERKSSFPLHSPVAKTKHADHAANEQNPPALLIGIDFGTT
jgi:hypothetical protein